MNISCFIESMVPRLDVSRNVENLFLKTELRMREEPKGILGSMGRRFRAV